MARAMSHRKTSRRVQRRPSSVKRRAYKRSTSNRRWPRRRIRRSPRNTPVRTSLSFGGRGSGPRSSPRSTPTFGSGRARSSFQSGDERRQGSQPDPGRCSVPERHRVSRRRSRAVGVRRAARAQPVVRSRRRTRIVQGGRTSSQGRGTAISWPSPWAAFRSPTSSTAIATRTIPPSASSTGLSSHRAPGTTPPIRRATPMVVLATSRGAGGRCARDRARAEIREPRADGLARGQPTA